LAPKLIRSTLLIGSILIALLVVPSARAHADGSVLPASTFPTLGTFADWVNDGQPAQLTGVYVPNVLADGVVQQPAGESTFVSPRQNIVTQFAAASELGSTGLLAHNFLAGAQFPQIHVGQKVYLVFGDGRSAVFAVTHILQYQALEPESPYSDFIDLSNNRSMSSSEVFTAVYGRHGAVILQTCIANNGNSSWGRLFVVAEPYIPQVWGAR
jgi:hypothetical protein